jgi:hypothetical protein
MPLGVNNKFGTMNKIKATYEERFLICCKKMITKGISDENDCKNDPAMENSIDS